VVSNNLSVSIIICTYKRPECLDMCLGSLEKQTVSPYEVIIVVDGGITSETQEVIDRFKGDGKLSIVQVTNSERKGSTASMNIGAEHAAGDIIAFLDDDVRLVPEWLAEILRGYHEVEDAAGVGGQIINIYQFMHSKFYEFYHSIRRFLFQGKMGKISFVGIPYYLLVDPSDKLLSVDYLHGGNMSFRREIFNVHKLDANIEMLDEFDLGIRITRWGKGKLIYNSKALLYHGAPGGGLEFAGRSADRLYETWRHHAAYLLKDFNLKYLRLALFATLVLGYSLLVRRPRYLKAIREGMKLHRELYQGKSIKGGR